MKRFITLQLLAAAGVTFSLSVFVQLGPVGTMLSYVCGFIWAYDQNAKLKHAKS